MEIIDMFIDKDCIVFKFKNGHEYDPDLRLTFEDWWIPYMRDNPWFTKEIEEKTKRLIQRAKINP